MSEFTHLVDLAADRLGGAVVAANDEFFAPKENLLLRTAPIFVPDRYTDRGKWMDGWETRRRRTPGHDWCIIRLGVPGLLRCFVVDTAFFRGNFPSHCSIDACVAPLDAPVPQLTAPDARWTEVLRKSELQGDTLNLFDVDDPRRFTHLRLNIFPDGGVARFRAMGEAVPDLRALLREGVLDLAAIAAGAQVVDTSDRFFGDPKNMLMPGRGENMGDGWETRRRRGPGHDWAIVRLALEGTLERIELDTAHFKGNFPESCSIDAVAMPDLEPGEQPGPGAAWIEVLPRTMLEADRVHAFSDALTPGVAATHLRLNIYPDGGVSRFRVLGQPTVEGRRRAMLRLLNTMDPEDALRVLQDCCGAPEWLVRMTAASPFRSPADLFAASDAACDALQPSDWLEAFRHHPRIGERRAERDQSAAAAAWSASEQAGVESAEGETLSELARLNRAYEARFGYVFLICAAGKSAAEMLDALRARLQNDPDSELPIAAAEQRRIIELRLEKLLS